MAHVLVVDDNAEVRDYVALVLSEVHEVLVARNGAEALSVVEDHSVKLDLLLTDIAMPGLNGVALAQMASLRRPALRIIYMTGFSEVVLEDAGELLGPVLEKPFRPAKLLAALAAALRGSKAQPDAPSVQLAPG